jgi:DNA-binding NtrC family response regulator
VKPGDARAAPSLESAWRAVVEVALGPAMLVDEHARVVAATPSAERLLGGALRRGTPVARVLFGDPASLLLAEAVAKRQAVAGALTNPRGAAHERVLWVRARPLEAATLVTLCEVPRGETPALLGELVTADPVLQREWARARRLAPLELTISFEGDAGTGRAALARAMHALSSRASMPAVELLAASASLHGLARAARAARGGTVIVRDAEQLAHAVQQRLSMLLDERPAQAGGRDTPPRWMVTVATGAQVSGQLDPALAASLGGPTIWVPSLSSRPADVALLAQRFASEAGARLGKRVDAVAPEALRCLLAHPWPGQVRELRAVMEGAVALGEGPVVRLGELPGRLLGETRAPSLAKGVEPTDSPEAARLRFALERAGGDRARAARMLGMSRTTLWRRMRGLGLVDVPAARAESARGEKGPRAA